MSSIFAGLSSMPGPGPAPLSEEAKARLAAEYDARIARGKAVPASSSAYYRGVERGTLMGVAVPQKKEDLVRTTPPGLSTAGEREVQVAKEPFAKGGVRAAFWGRLRELGSGEAGWEEVVLKEMMIPGERTLEASYASQAENSAVSYYLAKTYCETHSVSKPIEVLRCRVLRVGSALYNVEARMPATSFKKWTNNWGGALEHNRDLWAFSKWTHDFTDGYLMVTDMQGAEGAGKITLTDPAVLCTDGGRFGCTNGGRASMILCYNVVCSEPTRATGSMVGIHGSMRAADGSIL
jgi:hypothetical protein